MTRPTAKWSCFGGTLLVGIASGLMATLATLSLQAFTAPPALKLATVDIEALVTTEIARIKDSGVAAEQAEAYAARWGPLLERSLKNLAEEEGWVLLVGPSVVAGAPDLTGVLTERMRHEIARRP